MSCLISIVVPFYNSHHKSLDLMSTLSSMSGDDIEIIVVDDGSTPDEFELLAEDAARLTCKSQILRQGNKGPGGARNAGLKAASGEYVWFVDSDDNIRPEAIEQVRRLRHVGYDFMDFRITKKSEAVSSMSLDEGEYLVTDEVRLDLLRTLGRLCTKVFKRSWLVENGIYYPEHCIYEDNYLSFVLPFAASSLYCSDEIAYIHNVGGISVTRTHGRTLDGRYFDRLITAERGFRFALNRCEDAAQRNQVVRKFRNLFLLITAEKLWLLEDHDHLRRLFSAYLHIITGSLSEDEAHNERLAARRVLLKRAENEEQRAVREAVWESAAPSADSLEYFTSLRDAAWSMPANFPS
ncbi:glycosyltransferase involved in cell wall biosynthesis [Arthrobacter sp. V4I6]|nr:glycosyltransferase involved in cell wall biosynthesis [Arthrobacter sp. V4I6]